ncbi:hypothetical protein ACIQM4_00315 [Streptomyces sp. NPDC091272]|uniref:hypothetical protein n=1 Tax=Streptomyces sp. NPDC091272 TaxID=3365981 RepID=UPI0037FF2C4C
MPLIHQESQIHESAQGPRATPAAGRTAPTPRPVPGPRPAAVPRPGPARPAPPIQRTQPPGNRSQASVAENRSAKPAAARVAASAAAATAAAAPSAPVPAATPVPVPAAAPAADSSQAQIQLIPAPANGALDAAGEAVDLLLDSGRAPGEVLVLTTGEQHPWAAHELTFGEASYWAQHDAGDDVFYADVSTLERAVTRPVVIVAVNDTGPADVLARTLPAARDRAGVLMIVCGDPERVNSGLGAGV